MAAFRRLAEAAVILCVTCAAVAAQTPAPWPQQPVKMIVPFAAGGGTDWIARLVAKHLSDKLGQTVFIENRAGANGIVGLGLLKTAAPDGYTIGAASDGPLITNHALYKEKLSYDSLRDFAPVAMMIKFPAVLAVHPSVPARTTKELIAHLKANPGKLNFSSGGVGNYGHLALEMFMQATGTKIVHVPFGGTGPATQALIAGDVQIIYNNVQSTLQAIEAKQVVGIAVGEPARLKDLPNLPAITEEVPGFEMAAWTGMIAPAGTPTAIVDRLAREVEGVLRSPEVLATFAAQQVVGQPMGPAQFTQYIKDQRVKWDKIIDSAGIKIAQ